MNTKDAYAILGFENVDNPISLDELKRAYRIRILKYHPDKNGDPDAAQLFRDTKDAYDYLLGVSSQSTSYETVLESFISSLFEGDSVKARVCTFILKNIIKICNKNLVSYLKKIDHKSLQVIHDICLQYGEVLHLPLEFLEKIREVLQDCDLNAAKQKECIILHPFLEDLFSENIYKLQYKEEVFLVPLWHHDMVYDCQGEDVHVKCIPVLPDNMELDEYNNLFVAMTYRITDIWGENTLKVEVGGRTYTVAADSLRLTPYPQTVVCNYQKGITSVNVKAPFDVSKKQYVYLRVTLEL
jgi:hypothetical protein